MSDILMQDTPPLQTYVRILLVITVWVVVFWLNSGSVYPIDFSSIYIAATFYADGAFDMIFPPSDLFFWDTPPLAWRAQAEAAAAQFHTTPEQFPPYIYPPLWAAVFAPFTEWVSFRATAGMNLALNLVSGAAMIWMGAALFDPRAETLFRWVLLAALLSAISMAGDLSFNLGQAQVFVSALVLLSMLQLSRGRDFQAGGWLALAAAIKLTPALFVVIFVMERRWQALAVFAVVGGALAGLSVMTTGWALHEQFMAKLGMIEGDVLLSRVHLGLDQALFYAQQAVSGGFDWAVHLPRIEPKSVWIDWSIRLCLLCGICLTWWVTRRLDTGPRLWGRLLLLQLLSILASPLGWLHYLFLPLLLLPGLIELRPTRAVWAAGLMVLIGFSVVMFSFIFKQFLVIPVQSLFHVALVVFLFSMSAVVMARAPRGEVSS